MGVFGHSSKLCLSKQGGDKLFAAEQRCQSLRSSLKRQKKAHRVQEGKVMKARSDAKGCSEAQVKWDKLQSKRLKERSRRDEARQKTETNESVQKLSKAKNEAAAARRVEAKTEKDLSKAKKNSEKMGKASGNKKVKFKEPTLIQATRNNCVAEMDRANDAEKLKYNMEAKILNITSELDKCSSVLAAAKKKEYSKASKVTLSKSCGASSRNLWRFRRTESSEARLSDLVQLQAYSPSSI